MVRLAHRQRTTIGTLKALGYTNRELTRHALAFGVSVGVLGGLAGGVIGLLLSLGMIEMYQGFFQFPRFVHRAYPDLLLAGLIVSVLCAMLGTTRGAWQVLRLQPAEAMRERPPERGGSIFLERFPRLWRKLGFRTHMALRSLIRNRIRTATTVFTLAISTAIMLLALVMYDSFLYLVDYQFEMVARSDVDLGLRDEQSMAVVEEARRLPGVDYAEPVLSVRADLRNGRYSRRMSITGLAASHRLTTPRIADGAPVRIPRDGLVLSRKLAELLQVRVGDALIVTPVRGRPEPRRARVAATIDSFLGLDVYADMRYLSRLVGESTVVSGVQLSVNPHQQDRLVSGIKELPSAQGLSVLADVKRNIVDTLVKTSVFSIGLLILFAGMIAFGSALNNALVEMGDRQRELSTLRVLGYRPGEVTGVLLRQNMLTFAAGLLLAFPLGFAMICAIRPAYDTELYRMPFVVRPVIVLYTAGLALAFVLLAQCVVYRQVRRLDWLEGVKVRE
jgi:putative ABC transport system permease protein